LEKLRSDSKWLAGATDAILQHWREKNSQKLKSAVSLREGETDLQHTNFGI
jgi:hypothetical protein